MHNLSKLKIPSEELLEVLYQDYTSLIMLDFKTLQIHILKAETNAEDVGKSFSIQEYIAIYTRKHVHQDDLEAIEKFTTCLLQGNIKQVEHMVPIELRYQNNTGKYDWIKVECVRMRDQKLLMTTRICNEDHMLRKIIDLYVFRNFDFFVLIDATNNTYAMFSGKPGVTLPPIKGSYEEEVRAYNQKYVVPEDLDFVNEHMMIANIQKELENCSCYEFTAGQLDEHGAYRRSRVQFQYYDRCAQLIITTRLDVTQLYLEESKKERELARALREAKHDAMSDLFNKKATGELVSHALHQQYREQAVIFFIDIDNFKSVNDTMGHLYGDELLRYMGKRLVKIASKDGIAGRLGGDEFLLFLPLSDMERIKQLAQTICTCLHEFDPEVLENLSVSCSVGISLYPSDGTEYEPLLHKADQALYEAKRKGKHRFAFYQ